MPLQNPSSCIISRSYSVRWRMRCASSMRPCRLEAADLLVELGAQLDHGALDRRLRGDVLGRREDRDRVEPRERLAGERVEVGDRLDLVAEERDAVGGLGVGRLQLEHVAAHAEAAAPEHGVVADVLDVDQLAQHEVAVVLLAGGEEDDALLVLLWRAEAVDARDRGDDDDVAAREQARGGGVAQPVDVVVARAVLLDVEVGLRDVGLGLVVVVVGDEVLDRVGGEELAELVAELRGERLVVRDHERRAADLLDDPGHRRRLAGPGRAEQRLVALAGLAGPRRSPRSPRAGRRSASRGRRLQLGHRPTQRSQRRQAPRSGLAPAGVTFPRAPRAARAARRGPRPQSPQSKSRERVQRFSSETSSEASSASGAGGADERVLGGSASRARSARRRSREHRPWCPRREPAPRS